MKSKKSMKGASGSENFNNIITQNLIAFVRSNNLSQKDLAETLNVSEATVSRLLAGKSRLSIEKMFLLRETYGVELDYFFSGIESDKFLNTKASKVTGPKCEDPFEKSLGVISEELNRSYGTDAFDEKMIRLTKLFLKFTGVRGL